MQSHCFNMPEMYVNRRGHPFKLIGKHNESLHASVLPVIKTYEYDLKKGK